MVNTKYFDIKHFVDRLESGAGLLPDTAANVCEVVGILDAYGIVIKAYSENLLYMAQGTFLELFPVFKYFNGEVNTPKLLRHWRHQRINYEYAEYCMRGMLWHGGGGLDAFLDTAEFRQLAQVAIAKKVRNNPLMALLNRLFPEFLLEQVRQLAYIQLLGLFWDVMQDIFITLAHKYRQGEITTIPAVIEHIKIGLVAAAAKPLTYTVAIGDQTYPIIPAHLGLTFIADAAIPYVEAIFLRGAPFFGVVSYNAQAHQIPGQPADFAYGALFADPLPLGGAGIPPTLLMQDMIPYLPDYLLSWYQQQTRQGGDLSVLSGISFQKSMFCVTSAAILGLAPYAYTTQDPTECAANRVHFEQWLERLSRSELETVNRPVAAT